MNQDQILSIVRSLLVMFGTSLVTKGFMNSDQLNTVVGVLLPVIGALMTAAPVVWGIWRNTHKNTLAAAAALPKVQTIITTDQVTADKVPNDKVVGPDQISGATQ